MAAVAHLYAGAFADVAEKSGLDSAAALAQLQSFAAVFQESHELRELMLNPAVTAEQKLKVLDAIVRRLNASVQVRNFLAVLLRHDRMAEVPEIVQETQRELDRRSGVVEAQVVSARELTPEQRKKFETQIAQASRQRSVRADYKVDPSLLGGATVKIGSTVYDGSVLARMEQMRRQLASS